MRFIHFRSTFLQALAAVILLAGCGIAPAATIISNLNGNDQNATTLVGNLKRSKAIGFTMPGTVAYQLDSAVLRLDVTSLSLTIAAGIYASTAGAPSGPALATFTMPAFVSLGIQNYTITPSSAFLLQPSTTYFFVAYGNSSGTGTLYIDWLGNSTNITPTGVGTYAGVFADNTGGNTVPPTTVSGVINSLAINATVPETGMATILITILLAPVIQRRRQKNGSAIDLAAS